MKFCIKWKLTLKPTLTIINQKAPSTSDSLSLFSMNDWLNSGEMNELHKIITITEASLPVFMIKKDKVAGTGSIKFKWSK